MKTKISPVQTGKTEKLLMWAGILTMLGIVWYFSAQPAVVSSDTSGRISRRLAEFFFSVPTESQYRYFEVLVRKAAHMSEYGFLFLLLSHACKLENDGRASVRAALGVFLYACSDELHQSFVPGRSCLFTDVLIDMMGVGFAVILRHYAKLFFGLLKEKVLSERK